MNFVKLCNWCTPLVLVAALNHPLALAAEPVFRAGAATIDISPPKLPAIIAGGFLEGRGTKMVDPLHARCIVLDDGKTKLGFAIVDTCMMTQTLIDEAKNLASASCGIPMDHLMVSATHTHSAPAAMGCLGTRLDKDYAAWLPAKIAEGLLAATQKLQPARIGWTSVDDWEHTHNRRWIRKPENKIVDPFGDATALANMHPGYLSAAVIGPSGPVDPGLSVVSIQTLAGAPLAVLANYSQHYFGSTAVSSDYYGLFCKHLAESLGQQGEGNGPFVCAISQGTSGDLMWMDYGAPKKAITLDSYAKGVVDYAMQALAGVHYQDHVPLGIVEKKLPLRYRLPDEKRLEWARPIAARIENDLPKDKIEVYAREALILQERQQTELKLQAIRIGDLTIATLPNEVYSLTGLKLKAQAPLGMHFNIELANGAEGYIPPPEQHDLGGYTTWPARTAGLEVQAEPKILSTLLGALEEVTGQKRREMTDSHGPYALAVLDANPIAYWRMNESAGTFAHNAVSGGPVAHLSKGAAWYLPGVGSGSGTGVGEKLASSAFSGPKQINRAVHLAGGSIRADLDGLGESYSVAVWFWLGESSGASERRARLLAGPGGETLEVRQNNEHQVQLEMAGASSTASLRADDWHFAVLVRESGEVRVYVDGAPIAELTKKLVAKSPAAALVLGEGLQGKLDEVAVFNRALTPVEVAKFWMVSGIQSASTAGIKVPAPLAPEESLKKLHLPAGYKAEIVANEPLVLDPVAFDWDERGRLWVVEMADYPLGMDGNGKPGGRVRILEDTLGNGHYDKSTIFAEGLNFPNGILTWRGGAIVSAAPNVLFLQDTDGDGKADKEEVLLTGLQEGNQQLRANGLRWGLDNWVYMAIGGHHGKYGADTKLTSLRSHQQIQVGARDFRFRPDTGELEPQSGPTQFGRNRDNWGHWFGTQNAHPLWHYVLPEQYLRRNLYYAVNETRTQLLDPPSSPPVYPASEEGKRYHDFGSLGHYTSACSGVIYRDNLLFDRSATHAFVCEPVHNLVQHLVLQDSGVSFSAQQQFGDGKFDFFASKDPWCRPVMAREGPDGALWIADMYRFMIEHPHWLPAGGKEELLPHYRLGDDRGRIYRVAKSGMPEFKPVRFDRMNSAELVASLESSNGWIRDKAHQVLFWRAEKTAVAPLLTLAERSPNPLARLHSLCVLDGLDALPPAALVRALKDASPGVRENALRLAETRFTPEVLAAALPLVADPDAKVRLQLAFSLGASAAPAAGDALGKLLLAHVKDPMLVAAVMTSATPHLRALSAAVSGTSNSSLSDTLLTIALGSEDRDAIAVLIAATFQPANGRFTPAQLTSFGRLLDQLAQSNRSLDSLRKPTGDDALSRLLAGAPQLLLQARATASNSAAPALDRIASSSLLGRDPSTRAGVVSELGSWLAPHHSVEVQSAAIHALSGINVPEVLESFVKAWPGLGLLTRPLVLSAWQSREPWAFDLLQRIERGELAVSTLDPTVRGRLLKNASKRVSQLAQKVLLTNSSPRSAVVESYLPALALKGEAQKGHQTFTAICAACHKRGGEGRDIGPDLLSVMDHPGEKLLSSILDPSADIQIGFHAYSCSLVTGEEIYGLLASESANSVVLKLVDGSNRTVLRSQIKTLQSQNLSLMPEGLEAALNHQQMADLIAFLKSR